VGHAEGADVDNGIAGVGVVAAQNQGAGGGARAGFDETFIACNRAVDGERAAFEGVDGGRAGGDIEREDFRAGDREIVRRIQSGDVADGACAIERDDAVLGDEVTKRRGETHAVSDGAASPVDGVAPVAIGVGTPCAIEGECRRHGKGE